jgi:hypothetical protein
VVVKFPSSWPTPDARTGRQIRAPLVPEARAGTAMTSAMSTVTVTNKAFRMIRNLSLS